MQISNTFKKIIELHCNFESCYVKLKVYIHNIYSTIDRVDGIQLPAFRIRNAALLDERKGQEFCGLG